MNIPSCIRNLVVVFAFFAGTATMAQGRVESKLYDLMLKSVLKEDVPNMDARLFLLHSKGWVILDAREADEYEVSHLPGAIHIGFDERNLDTLSALDKTQGILVYCSVGYRSEIVTRELLALGFEDVVNLYGGIFEYVNQGGELVDMDDRPTQRVHAYSRTWGVWLSEGEKVFPRDLAEE